MLRSFKAVRAAVADSSAVAKRIQLVGKPSSATLLGLKAAGSVRSALWRTHRAPLGTMADIMAVPLVPRDPATVLSTDCRTGKAADPAKCDLLVYHKDCYDGFGAAYACWKARGDAVQLVGAAHGPTCPIDLDVRGRHVVVADFCFPEAVTRRMMAEAASFIVLDHHASAEKELATVDAANKVFEMKQSGATLAWNYFHSEPVPTLLRYIEDRDLWRWTMPFSREFSAGFTTPYDLRAWDAVAAGGDDALRDTMRRGAAILEYRNSVMADAVAKAVPCTLRAAPEFVGRIVNTTTLTSEIGNALATMPGVDYAFMWSYNHESNAFTCSLRSASDAVDVSVIAKAHGGGGHPRASGFSFVPPSTPDARLAFPLAALFTQIGGKPVPI